MDRIGGYQILETIHRGPQPLYRAKAPDGRIVAVKTIPVAGLTPENRERFLREAETCRGLDHPNLVRVYDSGEAEGVLFQAMDLLQGADLGKVLGEGHSFTWDERLSIMEQVCDGLQYAHDHQLVHRDIKPANLYLENSGRVRIVDFGMVRVAESELTKVGSSLGTLNYMSPEQIRGERCTAASDVFAAGIVFYQLATGRHPFSRKDRSLAQVVSAIAFETPASLAEVCPDAPEGLSFIIHKALEKDPAKRIQNGGDLKQALALCRVTMKLGVVPAATAKSEEPKSAPAAEAVPFDGEKTRVMRRAAPASPVAPVAPPPAPAIVIPQRPAPAQVPTIATAAAAYRYCPSCTTPNEKSAPVCKNCGAPLPGAGGVQMERSTPWLLYGAIAAAVLLAVALIVVLVTK